METTLYHFLSLGLAFRGSAVVTKSRWGSLGVSRTRLFDTENPVFVYVSSGSGFAVTVCFLAGFTRHDILRSRFGRARTVVVPSMIVMFFRIMPSASLTVPVPIALDSFSSIKLGERCREEEDRES